MPKDLIKTTQTKLIIYATSIILCCHLNVLQAQQMTPNDTSSGIASNGSWLSDGNLDEQKLRQSLLTFRNALLEVSSILEITVTRLPPNCILSQCRIFCFNGRYEDLEYDISLAIKKSESKPDCAHIEELRIYSYYFPNGTIPYGFLGKYSRRIGTLYIGVSNITHVAGGAFGNSSIRRIILEDLNLRELNKNFFQNISNQFDTLAIYQNTKPIPVVTTDFLDKVKYQIKSLTLQAGLHCIRNLTASSNLLAKLSYVDFSFNNFTEAFQVDTFNKLSMVETLNLAHSEIEYLPSYVFGNQLVTLNHLDISYNKLKTISRNIFGWFDLPRDLIVYAADNPWDCSCELHQQMHEIFVYQSPTQIFCASPEEYEYWSVFDERLCGGESTPGINPETTTESTTQTTPSTTTTILTTTTFGILETTTPTRRPTTTTTTEDPNTSTQSTKSTTVAPPHVPTFPTVIPPNGDVMQLKCDTFPNTQRQDTQYIAWPHLNFFATAFKELTVRIIVDLDSDAEATYGLYWFSKATAEYYKMEMFPDEYGLGCYDEVPYVSVVENLVPDMAYTFCVVELYQRRISPFSCQSVKVGGNLDIYYNTWRSTQLNRRSITLMVFGIVMFLFVGIAIVFLVLKQKPFLLKGSKRILKPKDSKGEIVVLPKHKTAKDMQHREAMLASQRVKRSPLPTDNRRLSLVSATSTDSYMNANLYEAIPSYLKFETEPIYNADSMKRSASYYYATIGSHTSESNSYAQIPIRSKRVSSDPLPELPTPTQTTKSLQILPRLSDASGEYISTMDGHI